MCIPDSTVTIMAAVAGVVAQSGGAATLVDHPERFERPYDTWSGADRLEFQQLMNKHAARPLTLEQIQKFEYAAEFDLNSQNEPLTKTQQVALMGYLFDKLGKTRGKLAQLKLQYKLAKKGGKMLVDAVKGSNTASAEV